MLATLIVLEERYQGALDLRYNLLRPHDTVHCHSVEFAVTMECALVPPNPNEEIPETPEETLSPPGVVLQNQCAHPH